MVDPVQNKRLARFDISSHLRSHPKSDLDRDKRDVCTTLDAKVVRNPYLCMS